MVAHKIDDTLIRRTIGTVSSAYMDIDPAELEVDPTYQRPLDDRRVRNLAEGWDSALCDPLHVNLRHTGVAVVVDGQHRLAAALRAKQRTVPCRVHDDLSVEQEAALFNLLQRNRAAIVPVDAFRSRVRAGEPDALSIMRLVDRHGGTVDLTRNSKSLPRPVTAVATLDMIYQSGGTAMLDRVLRILAAAWRDDRRCFGEVQLSAMYTICTVYGEELDERRLAEAISVTSPLKVERDARGRAADFGGATAIHAATAMAKAYNSRSRSRKLDLERLAHVPRGAGRTTRAGMRRTAATGNLLSILRGEHERRDA